MPIVPIDLAVPARHMQVLGPALRERLAGRAIIIHRSFLPSFEGARPQARGLALKRA